MNPPLIGITVDCTDTLHPDAGVFPLYSVKQAYTQAVLSAGGTPILLPYDASAEHIVQLIDGLVVTGGKFDLPTGMYGEAQLARHDGTKPTRTAFEAACLRGMIDAGKPVLGICGGMQLLNVILGGTLIQDIGTEHGGAIQHEQTTDRRLPAHDVAVAPGSRLAAITGAERLGVNSTHHQAPAAVAPGLRAAAWAPDGVIEALESAAPVGPAPAPFIIGVQWHPELMAAPAHAALYKALVEACRPCNS